MPMLSGRGARASRLRAYLRRRDRTLPAAQPSLDCESFPALFRKRAVVFTDTADFTIRTARDGILHFLMLFDRAVRSVEPGIRRAGGRIVKVEGDSLLIKFPSVTAACRGVAAIEAGLERVNRGRLEREQLVFSYGIGFGDVIEIEDDVFGLEVNLASRLGEDLAHPGDVLLTPGAVAALDARTRQRLTPYGFVPTGKVDFEIQQLKLAR